MVSNFSTMVGNGGVMTTIISTLFIVYRKYVCSKIGLTQCRSLNQMRNMGLSPLTLA